MEPGCPGIAKTGKFCDAHKADNYIKRRNAARPERDSWYDLAAWRGPYGARGYKLRHDPMCEIDGCGKSATDVHHIDDSWKQTGDFRLFIDQKNLQSLCHEHHSAITMKENNHVRTQRCS
jgi:hypothetical protein